MAPLVTIGLPFHNEANFLGGAIASMLAQTFSDFELVLVDDGSTDASLAVARSFVDPRVRVIADAQRMHLPARLNQITRLARGQLVARMDADDVSHPTRLARQVAALRAERLDIVGTAAALVEGKGAVVGVIGDRPLPHTRADVLRRGGLLVHPTILGHREWFLANPYDEVLTRAEDFELWCRTVETLRCDVISEPLHMKRIAPQSRRFIEGYALSHRQNRAAFLQYGPHASGLFETTRMCVASHAKVFVMRAVVQMGIADRVVWRKARPVRDDERALLDEMLALGRQDQRP